MTEKLNFFQHMEKKLDVLLSKRKMFEYWTSSASTLKNEKSCIKKVDKILEINTWFKRWFVELRKRHEINIFKCTTYRTIPEIVSESKSNR